MYDIKKTFWKFGKSAIYVIVAGLFSVYANEPWLLAIAPVLHAIENYAKHKSDM